MCRGHCSGKEYGVIEEGKGWAASVFLTDALEAAGPLESCGCRGADHQPVAPLGLEETGGVLARARWLDPEAWDPDRPMSGEKKARVPVLWWPGHGSSGGFHERSIRKVTVPR